MNKLLIPAICLLLSGCFYQTLDNVDIRKGIHYCDGADNIRDMNSTFLGDEYVVCVDGARTHLMDVKLPRKQEKQIEH